MIYSCEELSGVTNNVFNKIRQTIYASNNCGELDDYLTSINCSEFIHPQTVSYYRKAKVIVIGATQVSIDTLRNIVKENGLEPDRFEFHLDYDKNKRFNVLSLKNNFDYSDIILGPNAHKMVEIGEYSSVSAMIKDHSNEYPRLTMVHTSSGEFKMSSTSFNNAIKSTQAFADAY